MSDNLPINTGDDDDGLTIWKILLGAGGVIAALWLLGIVLGLLSSLFWFVLKWGIIAALLYGGYRVVRSMMGADDDSGQRTLPEEEDDYVLEDMSHEAAAAAEDPLEDDLEKEFAELEKEMENQ